MGIKLGLSITRDSLGSLMKKINELTEYDILVGVPDSPKNNRKMDEAGKPVTMNNATLAYIHNMGAPEANIPARPFLFEGIKENQAVLTKSLQKIAEAHFDSVGDMSGGSQIRPKLEAVALQAETFVKMKLKSGPWTPLKDATIAARARRGRKGAIAELASRKAGNAPDAGNVRPLIDTAQMLNSIVGIVRKKESGKHWEPGEIEGIGRELEEGAMDLIKDIGEAGEALL
jgi:hypothetical protein